MEMRRMTAKIELKIRKLKIKNCKLPKIPVFKALTINNIPIIISVKKALIGIFDLQCRHLPRKNKKEKTGNRSMILRPVLHEKQKDRPFKKESPVLYLSATTLTKLPTAPPNKKMTM